MTIIKITIMIILLTSNRVPQMGWNGVSPIKESIALENVKQHDGVCYNLYFFIYLDCIYGHIYLYVFMYE
jgi:imidazoleglycerol phosphate synthase glutamine amidotransferase subunit HisH